MSICCTIFFSASLDGLVELYNENAMPANGYLTDLGECLVMVDAVATETANWGRQIELATAMCGDEFAAVSLFTVGAEWMLALHHGPRPPISAFFDPDDEKLLEELPHNLLKIERTLDDIFSDDADPEAVDRLFGALVERAMHPEEVFKLLIDMLGCPIDWLRWSWYEVIPEQIFLDPDLKHRVTPLGSAKEFWEE